MQTEVAYIGPVNTEGRIVDSLTASVLPTYVIDVDGNNIGTVTAVTTIDDVVIADTDLELDVNTVLSFELRSFVFTTDPADGPPHFTGDIAGFKAIPRTDWIWQ